jgi:hypothetical protein
MPRRRSRYPRVGKRASTHAVVFPGGHAIDESDIDLSNRGHALARPGVVHSPGGDQPLPSCLQIDDLRAHDRKPGTLAKIKFSEALKSVPKLFFSMRRSWANCEYEIRALDLSSYRPPQEPGAGQNVSPSWHRNDAIWAEVRAKLEARKSASTMDLTRLERLISDRCSPFGV